MNNIEIIKEAIIISTKDICIIIGFCDDIEFVTIILYLTIHGYS
ncbi:MAG: hypothetical protein AB8V06_08225 [Francisella endosymbiont of Hyalomma asiaticum]